MLKRLFATVAAPLIISLVSLGLMSVPGPDAAAADPAGNAPRVKLATNMGDIVLELDAARAPKTVANFLAYVRAGHYDGTIFHRIIKGFMIQGGGFTPDFKQKDTRGPVRNEADNGLRNDTGTVAMARTGDPHSATAQFFINVKDNGFLNHTAKTQRGWGYTVFGRVVDGMDVVRRIEGLQTYSVGSYDDVPRQDAVIEKATVVQ